ncbi:hypothetical protein CDD80_2658 [Ophiocordyceps camponoti-rufipedis]|uniref:Uncharacterized protein n=1 Tax=Ophiocordyceps camponoti-rufipedis TaxID=2004952 RepID=A0A2C5Z789_9HYPO|nr:hypothetical protein CDD80_2658 [Ophiocordyceps camponoti-rufipedis]
MWFLLSCTYCLALCYALPGPLFSDDTRNLAVQASDDTTVPPTESNITAESEAKRIDKRSTITGAGDMMNRFAGSSRYKYPVSLEHMYRQGNEVLVEPVDLGHNIIGDVTAFSGTFGS